MSSVSPVNSGRTHAHTKFVRAINLKKNEQVCTLLWPRHSEHLPAVSVVRNEDSSLVGATYITDDVE